MDAAPPDNDSDDRYLKPFPARRLLPSDRFCGSDATVLDFWAWGFSDLRSNTVRGILAEYLVAQALGVPGDGVRDAWDNYDVLASLPGSDGRHHDVRVEVKSSGYLQSWAQKSHSQLVFGRLTGFEFDATHNEYSTERRIRADVFVFAIQMCKDPAAYDMLALAQWEFWVCPAATVKDARARTVGIEWVRRCACGPFPFRTLREAVIEAASTALSAGDAD